MTDRELLELAARAAGYQFSYPYHSISIPLILAETGRWRQWDPRHDDGDALRLAVLLNLEIHSPKSNPTVMFRTAENDVFYQDTCIRLAILRAAAEIGKSMGGGE
ncbi:hypothetical protein QIT84_gp040 [Pseudomonas phage PP9W2]|uniref:Uncharacterized protein n=1 Tax=Pseudomonas phage PP9W2 TaxID=2914450 RepID=A0A9E6YK31_9CAUD|nr:hypothetical protein [Pseudomonas aeruginosa]YP_010773333.1 hypothetical protein QIT84_gp040 [Pseudomonas phage PP9W2]KRV12371.1 hypothetical protein AN458_08335 [Pseudomonas aeruginosa]KSQ84883.1 hypothetical protein APB42_29750 [Pseudomonas aeruginosa]OOH51779.1 hypothetical protein B0B27_11185 [Pseudomonas aeruginosa]QZD64669.1 hypothetical protein K3176_01155 [Pseudomonas aeruginosa]ULG00224.1 hypothetical protein [Pseudomonas phage PP9W2]